MIILDGKALSHKIKEELKGQVALFPRRVGLVFILVGNDHASQTYVKMKTQACQLVGLFSQTITFPENVDQNLVLQCIESLNADKNVDGILVQQPLPPHINLPLINSAIDPAKDVDGFHPVNVGKLLLGETSGFIPCTPLGIWHILKHYSITTAGKHVVILGRSNIVGKPLGAMLVQNTPHCNATVTIAHSRSENLQALCLSADILISAVGQPHFVQKTMIHKNATVIDVGINHLGKQLVGDVDSKEIIDSQSCHAITPVPGGVGPMTIACLLLNTVKSYQSRQ